MVEMLEVDVSVYSTCYFWRSFYMRPQLCIRHGPYGASKILASENCACVSVPNVRRFADNGKSIELFVGVTVVLRFEQICRWKNGKPKVCINRR